MIDKRNNELGELLSEAFPNKTKIVIHTVCRIILVIVICLAGTRGFDGLKHFFISIKGILIFFIIFIPSIIWGMYPLIHLKDNLKFYENGISINGHRYLLEQLGNITFYDYSYGIKNEQYMKSSIRNFNVTYIFRPKRAYNEAYFNNE